MKLKEKIKAIKLREKGRSYKEILEKVKVSKGTLSVWLRDIKLTPKQKNALYKKSAKKVYESAKRKQRKRIEKTKKIIDKAKEEVGGLIKNPLFLAGLMLYWAEGDKLERGYCVKFTNSDPAMIELMMKWFRKICNVPEEKFRISIHVHKLHSRKKAKEYWSQVTGISQSQFYKIFIKPSSLGQRKNLLYNGTCAIRINNIDLLRKIKGWIVGFFEKKNIRHRKSPRSLMDKAGLF